MVLLFVLPSSASAAFSFSTLVTFYNTNGAYPSCNLVQGTDGALYGTAANGGVNGVQAGGNGTVFKMSTDGSTIWTVSFNNNSGANPYAGVIQATDQAFYGTTVAGGTGGGYGTVFRITSSGNLTTIHSFGGNDGIDPYGGLVQAADGNLYGTTYYGGANAKGTVFRIATNGVFNLLYSFGSIQDSFGNDLDGNGPFAGLVQATDGNLYGTTQFGGPFTDARGNTLGTVFKISPAGTLTTLHSFSGGTDGAEPAAPLVVGADGGLYGTSSSGTNSFGTAFRITTNGVLTPLHSFPGSVTDGYSPNGLVQGTDGNFYGTTQFGGAGASGTIFTMTPSGVVTTLYAFGSVVNSAGYRLDGYLPLAGLVQAKDGDFYGTTSAGGPDALDNLGTVFKLAAPIPPRFQSITQASGKLLLTWSSAVGQTFQLQYTSDLLNTNWLDLGSTIVASNTTVSASDLIGTSPVRFYRVVLLP